MLKKTVLIGMIVLIAFSGTLSAMDSYVVRIGYSVFEVSGNGKALNFSVYSKTMSIDDILYSVDKSNYYYQKLSKLYDLDEFTLIKSGTWDGIVNDNTEINEGKPLFTHSINTDKQVRVFSKSDGEKSKSTININKELEVVFLEFVDEKAKFYLRVKNEFDNGKYKDTRLGKIVIQSGKSGSVGSMYNEDENNAILIVLWVESLKLNKNITQKKFNNYLSKIDGSPQFGISDQGYLDGYLGTGKIVIPKEYLQRVEFVEYDKPPRALSSIDPVYPKDAQEAGTEGTVIIQCYINNKGDVELVKLLRGTDKSLDVAAVKAIKNTKFKPAQKDGRPIGVWISIPIHFSLKNK